MTPEVFTLILNMGSITALVLTGLGYVRRDAQRQRDAERDFGHLKRNYEQMAEVLKVMGKSQDQLAQTSLENQELLRELDRSLEALHRTMIEGKAAIGSATERINYVASRMDGGWGRTPH